MLNAEIVADGQLVTKGRLFRSEDPQTTPILSDVSRGFSSIVQIARDVLINPDVSYRTDKYLQEQMLRDPIIMGPLSERKLMVAQLPWEVVPEDEDTKDEVWKQMAKDVQKIVLRMQHMNDFFKQLLWADWRGTGASEIEWKMDADRLWVPSHSLAHHGDSITFDLWGNPRILTTQFQTGGRELTPDERDRLIIHTYQPDMGFFYRGEEAGYRFKGRALRDICWPYWWLAHNATRFWVRFIQRFGMGFVVGRYPMGNAAAKTAIESVLTNLIEDSNVSMPVPDDAQDRETYGVEFPSMGAIGEKAGVFKEFVEGWAAKHIRIMVCGQEQAHEEQGEGLGSGRSKSLSDVRTMYRDDSAKSLEDTLTSQFLSKVVWFNYGATPYRVKWKFTLERDDYKEQAERVKAAKDAGLQVPRAWVHDALRAPMPMPGEDIIDFGASAMPDMTGLGGGLGEDDSPTLFREALRQIDKARYATA